MVQFYDKEEFQVTPKCNFCILFVKTLESMLPKQRTEVRRVHRVKGHGTRVHAKTRAAHISLSSPGRRDRTAGGDL